MLDFLKSDEDALVILKHDHDTVKALFERFKKTDALEQKKKIAAQAIEELRIHAAVEEELVYPALRGKKDVDQDLLNESDEEHHVAKLLIAELLARPNSDHFVAKFTVLSENIEHHVKEEESDLFPQARKTNVDFTALGKKVLARKAQLKKNGVPPTAEEKLMARNKSADSPAQAARSRKPSRAATARTAPARKPAAKRAKPAATKARTAKRA